MNNPNIDRKEDLYLKVFLDGSIEVGTDSMIQNKEISFSSGRQDIRAAKVTLNGLAIGLVLDEPPREQSEWKQSDGFIFNTTKNKSKKALRKIGYFNKEFDYAYLIQQDEFSIECVLTNSVKGIDSFKNVKRDSWIVISLDHEGNISISPNQMEV